MTTNPTAMDTAMCTYDGSHNDCVDTLETQQPLHGELENDMILNLESTIRFYQRECDRLRSLNEFFLAEDMGVVIDTCIKLRYELCKRITFANK